MQYFTHVSDIGLTKKVGAKTLAGESMQNVIRDECGGSASKDCLTKVYNDNDWFADNVGYWYAEYPSAITMSKSHYNLDDGTEVTNIVISKVA